MQQYTLGIALTADHKNVVLIKKNRPEWQVGTLNFVGGKVEEGEEPFRAQCREFREETGIVTFPHEWTRFGSLHGHDYLVHLFYMANDSVNEVETKTDEEVDVYNIRELMVDNLSSDPQHKLLHNLMTILHFVINDAVKGAKMTLVYSAYVD
jgi:8-oxo-dGTP pyrophosphatase MutT (NUDIX family)